MNESVIDLKTITIDEASTLIAKQKISITNLINLTIEQITLTEPNTNAYISVLKEDALLQAQVLDDEIQQSKYRGPLHGIPIGLKDIIDLKGTITTNGSKLFTNSISKKNATVVNKLIDNGAIIIGKLNLHEFAFGTSSINPHYGAVKNPWDERYIAGGSSGGSAAAVAVGSCLGAIGTDTGGSIRIPAALCGVTGFMPTSGRVSKYGITPLSWSLDHVGPLTKTVKDACIILDNISGHDNLDESSFNIEPTNIVANLTGDINELKIGIPRKLLWDECDDEIIEQAEKSLGILEKLGAIICEVSLPMMEEIREVEKGRFRILLAEAATFHSKRIRENPENFGRDVLASLQLGSLVSATSYLNAQRIRANLIKESRNIFSEIDVLVSPTTRSVAPLIEEGDTGAILSRLTAPYNVLDIPSISVCCGFSKNDLPIGLMFASNNLCENTVANVAFAFEQNATFEIPEKKY
jgi:aspartyl-tRNA(Asn)/glutamyl-tRNA(Gln) amidotransferase subunit A